MSANFRLIIVGALVLLLLIPLALVHEVVQERRQLERQARATIEQRWSRAQLLGGPLIRLPVQRRIETSSGYKQIRSTRLLLPATLTIEGTMDIESRYYGIYQTPVYTSALNMSGQFDLGAWSDTDSDSPIWSEAELLLPVSDARGLRDVSHSRVDGLERPIKPLTALGPNLAAVGFAIDLSGVAPGGDGSQARFDFDFALTLAGTQSLQFVPAAEKAQVSLSGPWGDPGFIGQYLPLERTIGEQSFEAQWRVMALNRAYGQALGDGQDWTSLLLSSAFGVDLFQPAGVYQRTERATKYGILFIALTFMGLFVFEALTGKRLHPVQYLLLGLALCTFYIVLLALSEHIGFGWAYLLAAAALVAMVSGYCAAVLGARRYGIWCGAIMAAVYLLLYWLVISEAYSLLAGSLALLGMLAAIMYLTRHVDWFSIGRAPGTSTQSV